ncbi:MAG: ketoacyl-ACP synthase III [Hespellia sp.]|nr:ketoacyl-ACP synthase III [Hespellia sp.]
MRGKIIGTGSFAPAKVLDNNDLSKLVDTNDEWIRERTGVVRRHIAEDETATSMAAEAARRALENSKIQAEEIDLILASTISSNVILPCAACEVQREIGAVNATCFDLNAACTGFVIAYNTAQAYIAAGIYKNVLIIGVEALSNLVDWTDRGTCILFGDGAGAAVLTAEEGNVFPMATHSDGNRGEALTCSSCHNKDGESHSEENSIYIQMHGQEVFKFAVRKVPEVIGEVLGQADISIEEIDLFVLHQANKRIVESVAKKLKQPIEKFPMNMQEYGNTSSASVGILLDELNREGKLVKGQKIMIAGFGAGLTWGASLIEW